jgi:hypothetical protein
MIHQRKNKAEAIAQIVILIVGIFAISWMVGGEVGEVSAVDTCIGTCETSPCQPTQDVGEGVCTDSEDGITKNCCVTKTTTAQETCASKNGQCKFGCASNEASLTGSFSDCKVIGDHCCVAKTTANPSNSLNIGEALKKPAEIVSIYNTATSFASIGEKAKEALKDKTTDSKDDDSSETDESSNNYLSIIKSGGEAGATLLAIKKAKAAKAAYDAAMLKTGTTEAAAAAEGVKAAEAVKVAGSLKTFLFGTKTTAEGTTAAGWTGVGGESLLGAIGSIAVWSAIAFAAGRYIGEAAGLSIKNSQTLGYALAAGTAAGLIATSSAIMGTSAAGGPVGLLIGLVVAASTYLIFAKNVTADIVTYNCFQWDSKSGNGLTPAQMKSRCELCNSQEDLACTEYQCRSLGQGCILINEESTGRQLCIWDNPNDIAPPIIKPWEVALLDDFVYAPYTAVSTKDKGVKVVYTGTEDVTKDGTTKCAPPYTPISFGVQLDEAAICKINPLNLGNYSVMSDYYMGRGIRDFNHSFVLSLPSREALEAENITLENGGKYELYVRCQDANGNSNTGNFVFKFCISDGPDTTPPLILGTSILNNQPIAHGQSSIDLQLYVNEPSECKWSHLDKNYDAMENNMTCTTSVNDLMDICQGELTGLKDNQNNKFYFRCEDKPFLKGTAKENERNANTQSYPLNLIGTESLAIEEAGPNATTIEDSTNVIKVNLTVGTIAGYDEGRAICSFSESGNSGSYIDFFYGYDVEQFSQYHHSQELWLEEGNYTYFIKCIDKGGNMDDTKIRFEIKTDTLPPAIVRAYKENEDIKIITDEPGRCVYSTSDNGCNYIFDDGIEMYTLNDKEFYTEWNINNNLYIKCEDDYGNKPDSNACSLTARPFEIFELQ